MSFKPFLPVFSFIDEKFINDYNRIFDSKIHPDKCVIDSEIVREWLKLSGKQSFDKNIISNYREGAQYIIEQSTEKYKRQKILLSPSAAKHICMTSRSPIAKLMREYFLEVEKVYFTHYECILENKGYMDEIEYAMSEEDAAAEIARLQAEMEKLTNPKKEKKTRKKKNDL